MKPDEPQNDAERGILLLQLVQTPRNGASGNFDLADRCIGLLEKGAGTSFADEKGMTALMHAAVNYRSRIFDALLKSGADVNAKDKSGMTALDHALAKKQKPAAKTLEAHMAQSEKEAFKNLGTMAVEKPVRTFRRPVRFRAPNTPA